VRTPPVPPVVVADGVHTVDGVPYRYEISVDVASLVAGYVPRAVRNVNHLATIAYGIVRVTAQAPSGWHTRNPDGSWTHTATPETPEAPAP
jgi:hypothetical protein